MERRNKRKGGINEHPFLQKINLVGSKINKQTIRKGKKKTKIKSNSLC